MAFQDPLSSSNLGQDEIRNSPNSVPVKQKALGLNLVSFFTMRYPCCRRAQCSLYVFLIIAFCLPLFGIGYIWESWRLKRNEWFLFSLILLCVMLVLAVLMSIFTARFMISLWFQNVIQQKVKVLDDEEVKIGAPTVLLCFFGWCLFSSLAAIMGWQTNSYVEKGMSKHPDSFSLLLLIQASPYYSGLLSSILLALVFSFVVITYCCARILANTLNIPVNVATTLYARDARILANTLNIPVNVATTLYAKDTKMLGLKLFCVSPIGYQGGTISNYSLSAVFTAVFYSCLLLIGWVWAKWRIEGNDVFHLILLCVTLVGAVVYFIVMVGQIILWLFQNVIRQKVEVLDDGEEEIKFGTPILSLCFLGSCLFSVLAVIMGWQTNKYLEKGISKHPDSFLLLIHASPYCFGLVSLIVLAIVCFFVAITECGGRIMINTLNIPVSVATTLNKSDIKMPGPSDPAQFV